MGLDRVALRQVVTIAKNSQGMKDSIKNMENKVIDTGLSLIEKAGIDPNTLPIDIRSVLRGEAPTFDSTKLLTPSNSNFISFLKTLFICVLATNADSCIILHPDNVMASLKIDFGKPYLNDGKAVAPYKEFSKIFMVYCNK